MVGPLTSASSVYKSGMVVRTCANAHCSAEVVVTLRPRRRQEDAAAGDYDRGIVNLLGIVVPPRTMLRTTSGHLLLSLLLATPRHQPGAVLIIVVMVSTSPLAVALGRSRMLV